MSFQLCNTTPLGLSLGTLYHFIDNRTRCEVIHIHNDDPENIYIFAVPTYPQDNTGIAHILEHTVLSGSDKYRVPSPFFMLERGSCRTYLNASTYPDRTLYLGASTLKKDMFNLMAMSGDAVLYPLLREEMFRQEGFYFQFGNAQDPTPAGVVYHEMKGVYSDWDTLIDNEIQAHIFSDNLYRFDSGGTPSAIPQLTYKDFCSFHNKFYRPEYLKIVVYGNISSNTYLDFISQELLSRWKQPACDALPFFNLQPSKNCQTFDASGKETILLVPVEKSEHQGGESGSCNITWLLDETKDKGFVSMLRFVHFVLLGIPGAPLRKAIMESGLVEDLSPLSGFIIHLRQASYTIGGMGLKPEHYHDFKDLVFHTLLQICKQGISHDLQESARNRIIFSSKERINDTQGKVHWLSHLAARWLYHDDPSLYADIESTITGFQEISRQPNAIEHFIQKYFLQNTHRVVVGASPQTGVIDKAKQEEQLQLKTLVSSVDIDAPHYWKQIDTKVQDIHNNSEEYTTHKDTIPRLKISDLPREVRKFSFQEEILEGTAFTWIPHIDNGVIYFQFQFDITDIVCDDTMRLILPTFVASLSDIGVKDMGYEDVSIQIGLSTGSFSCILNSFVNENESNRFFLHITMSVLEEKCIQACTILQKILLSVNFYHLERLQEIINEGKSMMRSQVFDSGVMFSVVNASKNYSINALVDENWNAVSQLQWLINAKATEVLANQLDSLRAKIFVKDRMSMHIVSHERLRVTILSALPSLLSTLPNDTSYRHNLATIIGPYQNITWTEDRFGLMMKSNDIITPISTQALILPTQVADNVMVLPAVTIHDKNFAAHKITARIIGGKLLERIRMEYGAYGASATLLGDEGLLVCYTYRDPNIRITFEVFKQVIKEITQGNIADLESHIVGAVGESLISYSPIQKLKTVSARLVSNITDEVRQGILDDLLHIESSHVNTVAQQYLDTFSQRSIASMCNAEMATQLEWDTTIHVPH